MLDDICPKPQHPWENPWGLATSRRKTNSNWTDIAEVYLQINLEPHYSLVKEHPDQVGIPAECGRVSPLMNPSTGLRTDWSELETILTACQAIGSRRHWQRPFRQGATLERRAFAGCRRDQTLLPRLFLSFPICLRLLPSQGSASYAEFSSRQALSLQLLCPLRNRPFASPIAVAA